MSKSRGFHVKIFMSVCIALLMSCSTIVFAADGTASTLLELQNGIETALKAQTTSYTVIYTNSTAVTSSELTTIFNGIYNEDGNDYIHSNIKKYSCVRSGSSGSYTMKFTFTYLETAAQTAVVDTKVAEILASLGTGTMNDYQKEKAIHDWIITNVAYDTSLTYNTAYAALTEKKAVCNGYAMLAYKMFTQAGLSARIITGTADGSAHAWNLVQVDSVWYQIDLTWDDPTPDVANRIRYDYYNLTNSEIKADHTWTSTYPAASTEFGDALNSEITSDSANAAVYQALLESIYWKYISSDYADSTVVDITDTLQLAINSGESKAVFVYTNKNSVVAAVKAAVKNISNISSYSFSYYDFLRTTSLTDALVEISLVYTQPVNVTSISLSQTSIDMNVGGTSAITATVLPSTATNKVVKWTTSDTTVATVESGKIKGLKVGTATIKATTADGSFSATCTVNVTLKVSGITLNYSSLTMKTGGSDVALTATISPSTATVKTVTWTSGNPSVATVDSSGTVHAVAAGTANIIVKSSDGAKTAVCAVRVYDTVTGVTLSTDSLALNSGKSSTLKATVAPSTANTSVTWTTSDSNVAKVSSSGAVYAVAAGTAKITVTTNDGSFSDSCNVTVTTSVSGLSLSQSKLTMETGDDAALTATISPSTATIKQWSSSDSTIATVTADTADITKATVHAVKPGTVKITVTTSTGQKSVSCAVTIYDPVTSLALSANTLTMKMGTSSTLKATVLPDTASKTLVWTSSDTKIAKVSSSGLVTTVATGEAVIKVSTPDGSFTASCTVTVVQQVTGLTLNKTSLTLKTGGSSEQLTATITPSTASNTSVTWSSSKPAVATVGTDGTVSPVAAGTAYITAASADGSKTAKCTVNVYDAATKVTLSSSSMTLNVGSKTTLKATVAPSTASSAVTWLSSNTAVATVDSKGMVTPVTTGDAVITVTTVDGAFTATCAINVIRSVTGVTLNQSTLIMETDDDDVQLTATITPSNASVAGITWLSSNTLAATVDSNGLVSAVAAGTATITVTTKDGGKTAKCTVKVYAPESGISLSSDSLTLRMGSSATLKATVTPSSANQTPTWTSGDTSIVKVSSMGVLTPVSEGTTTITAATDGGYSDTCTVEVVQGVTGVTLNQSSLTLKVGDADFTLTATITPSTATKQTVTWKSSNEAVATVDTSGKVSIVGAGSANIIVTTTEGGKTAKCALKVYGNATGVTLSKSELTLKLGSSATLSASVTPSTAVQTVTWSSGDETIVTVNAAGKLTPVAAGTAVIKATADDGGYTASCTVTVIQGVTGVTLDKSTLALLTGASDTLTATVAPDDATNKDVTWSTSNAKVATVDENGKVTAVAAGTATITAKSAQDSAKYAVCKVTVTQSVTGITLSQTTLSIKVGDSAVKLTATITPSTATNKNVTWSSSDTSVATVDDNGNVTAVATGTVTITVTSAEDGTITDTCTVTVT